MPSTTYYAITYPSSTALVTNGPSQMQTISDNVDLALNTQMLNVLGRNLLHNNTFRLNYRNGQICQLAPNNLNPFVADRWAVVKTGGITATATRNATALGFPIPETIQDSAIANITAGGAAADYLKWTQTIERARTAANSTVKVSFYAKTSAGNLKVGVSWDQNFGTGGAPSATVTGTGTSVTISSTWARYTVTLTIPSVSGKTFGTNNDDYALLNLWFSAGSTYATASGTVGNQTGTISVTGIQAENDYVTPVEVRPDWAEELICARYFVCTYQQNVYAQAGGAGVVNAVGEVVFAGCSEGTGYFNCTWPFPVAMVKQPTVNWYARTTGASGSLDYSRSGAAGVAACQVLTNGNGRRSVAFRTTASIGATWVVALLFGHIVADTGY